MAEPTALWVLYRRKPRFDVPATSEALGPDAIVEGSEGRMTVRLRGHVLRVASVGLPLPQELVARCLPVAHLTPEQKDELAAHAAHAVVVHERDEPGADGFAALYETAWALRGPDLLGVINPNTWMSLTAEMLAETMRPEFVEAVRASPGESLGTWLGFVKLFRPDGATWLVTRGAALVGLPDLAWLATDLAETDAVFTMFAGVLDYAHANGVRLAVGDTVDFDGRTLGIREPYEYVEHIGRETLVLDPR